jgi:hypothetical protein
VTDFNPADPYLVRGAGGAGLSDIELLEVVARAIDLAGGGWVAATIGQVDVVGVGGVVAQLRAIRGPKGMPTADLLDRSIMRLRREVALIVRFSADLTEVPAEVREAVGVLRAWVRDLQRRDP